MSDLHKLSAELLELGLSDGWKGYELAFSACADAVDAAIPKWTKITDDLENQLTEAEATIQKVREGVAQFGLTKPSEDAMLIWQQNLQALTGDES